jgi:hypothetical protein
LVVLAVLAFLSPSTSDETVETPVVPKDTQAAHEPVRDTVYLIMPEIKIPRAPQKPVGAEDIDALFNEAAASFEGLD